LEISKSGGKSKGRGYITSNFDLEPLLEKMALSRLLRFHPPSIKLRGMNRFYASAVSRPPLSKRLYNTDLFFPQAFVPNLRPASSDHAPSWHELVDAQDDGQKPSPTLKKWMQTIAESKTVLSERSGLIDSLCKEYSICCDESRTDATDLSVEALAESWTFPRSMLIGPLLFTVDENAETDYEVWEHENRHVARTLFATYRAKESQMYAKWPSTVPFGAIGFRVSAIWSPIMPKAECSSLIARGRNAITRHDRLLLGEEIQKLMHAYDSPTAIENN
jgi:hypothetical protein